MRKLSLIKFEAFDSPRVRARVALSHVFGGTLRVCETIGTSRGRSLVECLVVLVWTVRVLTKNVKARYMFPGCGPGLAPR